MGIDQVGVELKKYKSSLGLILCIINWRSHIDTSSVDNIFAPGQMTQIL